MQCVHTDYQYIYTIKRDLNSGQNIYNTWHSILFLKHPLYLIVNWLYIYQICICLLQSIIHI